MDFRSVGTRRRFALEWKVEHGTPPCLSTLSGGPSQSSAATRCQRPHQLESTYLGDLGFQTLNLRLSCVCCGLNLLLATVGSVKRRLQLDFEVGDFLDSGSVLSFSRTRT